MSGPYPRDGREAYEDMSEFYGQSTGRPVDETECVPSRQQLLDFVTEVAGLSLLIADNDRERELIQRARTLIGQP